MKWLLIPALLLAACAGMYWLIPSELKIVTITPVHCPVTATYRGMSASNKWLNSNFYIERKLLNAFDVRIRNKNLPSTINLLPLPNDSTAIQWKCAITTSWNPITRWQRYQQAKAIRKKMIEALEAFKTFVQQKQNIYNIVIKETPLYDTVLVATKTTLKKDPGTADIYEIIQALQRYSATQQAQATGYPMLNITPQDSSRYQLMVALPINKRIPDQGPFFYRHLVPRKFLMTEARGGNATVQYTSHQLQLYIDDFRRTVMALPFQMLITDRSSEPDTAKWVTKIYVPIY